jgi:cytochrome P450
MRSQVLVLQGREHAWLHAAISTAMSAAHVDALRPAIRTIATGLLEAAREQG